METLHLLPRPRTLEIEEGGLRVDPAALPVSKVIDGAEVKYAGDEAYALKVGAEGIYIAARTEIGLRWAEATLRQLQVHAEVPCLEIQDAPRFAHRGVMLDISRDRVPTMQTLFDLVDKLAAWKMNHLQLYMEHTFAYQGHEAVWRSASPMTAEEMSALDVYAKARGVALTANQNCLGHLERWLRHPYYAPLGEMDRGHLVRGEHFYMPNTLCPTDPKSRVLIEDLLTQLLPLCSGTYANVGCDEPWDLGKGRSRAVCEARGRETVFSEHLTWVAECCMRLGKRPQFWCDPEPNEGEHLPKELVTLVWGYEADTPFAPRVEAHRRAGREVWVAPGTSCWQTVFGRTWNRRENLDMAARMDAEATGLLCTAWGDRGHRQPYPVTLAGFADAAMAAWSGANTYDDVAVGLHALGNADLGAWLAALGNLDAALCRGDCDDFSGGGRGTPVANQSALWKELHTNFFERQGNGSADTWEALRDAILQAQASFPQRDSSALIEQECGWALELGLWTCDRALVRRLPEPPVASRQELAARMVELIAVFRKQWLERSRYGGLEDSTQYFIHAVKHG